MDFDYLCKNKDELSTYSEEQYKCSLSNSKLDKKYQKINKTILEVEDYAELVQKFEIKTLDHKTGLKELKLDKIRVVHFLYLGNTFVFLGTFIKKSKKTPPSEIDKNNQRIKEYLRQKNCGGNSNGK